MTTDRDRTLSGAALVVVGVVSVQVGAGVALYLFPMAGPNGAVWLRLVMSAVIMAVLWPPARLPWGAVFGSGQRLGWTRQTWTAVVAFGLILAGMNWAFYEALDRIPLGIAVAVEFAGPLTLSIALSRRVLDVVWAAAAVVGLAVLTLVNTDADADADTAQLVGVGFAAIAGVLWAAYIVVSKRVGSLVPGLRGLSAALVVAAVVTIPVGLSAGPRLWDWRVLALAAVVALLSSVIPYGVELGALRRLSARVFGVLLSIEPAVAALVGLLVLGQLLTAPEWVGIVAVCVATIGAAVTARRTG